MFIYMMVVVIVILNVDIFEVLISIFLGIFLDIKVCVIFSCYIFDWFFYYGCWNNWFYILMFDFVLVYRYFRVLVFLF